MRKILLALLLLPSVAWAEFPAVRNDNAATTIIPTNGRMGQLAVSSNGVLFVNGFGAEVANFLVTCSSVATGTADTNIVPAVASNRIYVTSLTCSNTAAVASIMNLKQGAAGKWVYYVGANTLSNNVFHVTFPTPIRLTVNSDLNFAMATALTSTTCCATYFLSTL